MDRIPTGLCTCGKLRWSAAWPRPHDPAICSRYQTLVTVADASALDAWYAALPPLPPWPS